MNENLRLFVKFLWMPLWQTGNRKALLVSRLRETERKNGSVQRIAGIR